MRVLWPSWVCRLIGHRWRTTRDGVYCRRCGTWRPVYKQMFGPIKISGTKTTSMHCDDPLYWPKEESPRDDG